MEVALGRTLVAPGTDSPTVTYILPRADGQWQSLQTHKGEMNLTCGKLFILFLISFAFYLCQFYSGEGLVGCSSL